MQLMSFPLSDEINQLISCSCSEANNKRTAIKKNKHRPWDGCARQLVVVLVEVGYEIAIFVHPSAVVALEEGLGSCVHTYTTVM